MKLLPPLLGLAFALLAEPAAFTADKSVARGITRTAAGGWTEALQLDAKDTPIRAVVIPGFGGRVVSYGLRGDNVLWVDPETLSRGASAPGEAFEPGGFQCILGPESAAFAGQSALASGRYDWSTRSRSLLVLKSPEDKAARASIEREIMLDPASGELGFVHRLKNLADQDGAFTLWQRIACRPGGYVLVPLSRKSRFTAGWSVRRETGGKPTWDGTAPAADGVKIIDGVLVAKTGSGSARIGADSDAQWMAYAVGRTLFMIHFPFYASAVYAEGGNSVTFAWNEKFTELQPIGPEARSKSRRTAELPMKWSLLELPAEVTSAEQARALAEKVPASPFQ